MLVVFNMAGGVHIALFGAACTFSILYVAMTENMCTTMTLISQTSYTLNYSPDTHELKTCCCIMFANDADVSVSISSKATFFQLVFHANGTVKSLRNETSLSLSNSIQFCANKSESGLVVITGNKAFQVRCTFNTSVIVSTTVNVPLTSNTAQVGSGFGSVVLWIIIGSVTGVLVIIIGVWISCLVYRKRSRATEGNEGNGREGHATLMADNILYSHEISAYSLAKGAEPVDADDPGTEDVNDLMMSENCLYNHQEESSVDGNVLEGQGHYQTAGEQGQSGEARTHREEADFSHLYAKVDKTSSKHN